MRRNEPTCTRKAAVLGCLVALLALGAHGCGDKPEAGKATARLPRKATWEPVFFKEIDEKLRTCGLFPLRPLSGVRQIAPATDSVEIRVWAGFGLQMYPEGGHPLEGLVLRRNGDRFSGTRYPRAPGKVDVAPPSGWPALWRSLETLGVFDLPDSSEIQGYKLGLDGIAYVVEYRRGGGVYGGYGSYMYWEPAAQDLPEARQFVRLLDVLRKETGFDSAP